MIEKGCKKPVDLVKIFSLPIPSHVSPNYNLWCCVLSSDFGTDYIWHLGGSDRGLVTATQSAPMGAAMYMGQNGFHEL
jgi:hypothetical protein